MALKTGDRIEFLMDKEIKAGTKGYTLKQESRDVHLNILTCEHYASISGGPGAYLITAEIVEIDA